MDTIKAPALLLHRLQTAARILDTPLPTLRRWIERGLLRPIHIGRTPYLSQAEVERFVATLEPRRHDPAAENVA